MLQIRCFKDASILQKHRSNYSKTISYFKQAKIFWKTTHTNIRMVEHFLSKVISNHADDSIQRQTALTDNSQCTARECFGNLLNHSELKMVTKTILILNTNLKFLHVSCLVLSLTKISNTFNEFKILNICRSLYSKLN